jgi:GNAT superfamily N-acetyltransferase
VFNKDLGYLIPDEEIEKTIHSIGIREKRFAEPDVCASDLCHKAAEKLFEDNDIDKTTVDALIIDLSCGGKKLMNAMFDVAIKNGIKRCQWWVNAQNERAIGFYKKLGAISDGLKDYTYIKR